VVRYGPNKDKNYTYEAYKDVIDPILSYLVENEKGIELNTAALTKGLRNPNPCREIIKRYRELGGEIITIGSDSHVPETLGNHFDKAAEILTDCGFKYYCIFANRVAEFMKL
jgi:histidinol-phosphatase (PHP family)